MLSGGSIHARLSECWRFTQWGTLQICPPGTVSVLGAQFGMLSDSSPEVSQSRWDYAFAALQEVSLACTVSETEKSSARAPALVCSGDGVSVGWVRHRARGLQSCSAAGAAKQSPCSNLVRHSKAIVATLHARFDTATADVLSRLESAHTHDPARALSVFLRKRARRSFLHMSHSLTCFASNCLAFLTGFGATSGVPLICAWSWFT